MGRFIVNILALLISFEELLISKYGFEYLYFEKITGEIDDIKRRQTGSHSAIY